MLNFFKYCRFVSQLFKIELQDLLRDGKFSFCCKTRILFATREGKENRGLVLSKTDKLRSVFKRLTSFHLAREFHTLREIGIIRYIDAEEYVFWCFLEV